MDGVSMGKSVFMDTLGSMRQHMQVQNDEVNTQRRRKRGGGRGGAAPPI